MMKWFVPPVVIPLAIVIAFVARVLIHGFG
jgi:hypothetical protein